MGFLVSDLSISRCNDYELRLAILMLTEELIIQSILRGSPISHGRALPKSEYDKLYNELMEYEGLLYIKTRERLVWRSPGNYEWVLK